MNSLPSYGDYRPKILCRPARSFEPHAWSISPLLVLLIRRYRAPARNPLSVLFLLTVFAFNRRTGHIG